MKTFWLKRIQSLIKSCQKNLFHVLLQSYFWSNLFERIDFKMRKIRKWFKEVFKKLVQKSSFCFDLLSFVQIEWDFCESKKSVAKNQFISQPSEKLLKKVQDASKKLLTKLICSCLPAFFSWSSTQIELMRKMFPQLPMMERIESAIILDKRPEKDWESFRESIMNFLTPIWRQRDRWNINGMCCVFRYDGIYDVWNWIGIVCVVEREFCS